MRYTYIVKAYLAASDNATFCYQAIGKDQCAADNQIGAVVARSGQRIANTVAFEYRVAADRDPPIGNRLMLHQIANDENIEIQRCTERVGDIWGGIVRYRRERLPCSRGR